MLLRREGSVGYHTLRDHMFFAPRKSFLAFLRWSIVSKKNWKTNILLNRACECLYYYHYFREKRDWGD